MTSIERREERYQRRKKERENGTRRLDQLTFDDIFTFDNMWKSAKKSCKGSRWKHSTINFEVDIALQILKSYLALKEDKRRFRGYHSFKTVEHGKERDIDALHISERMPQKCFADYLVNDLYTRTFIYDNSSSLKGKGMDFAFRRLNAQLRHHINKYGLEGGILSFDFKSFFASLEHKHIKEKARKRIKDPKLYKIFCDYVDDYRKLKNFDKTAEEARGIGLGSGDLSQLIALDYASPIDYYVKHEKRIKGYGRYMDDGYVISNSIDELKEVKDGISRVAESIGIKLNPKKIKITPFRHHSFTFLKIKFTIKDSGRIIRKLSSKSKRSIKRKINKFREWVDEGKFDPEDAIASYQSWRAYELRFDGYKTLKKMDEYFVIKFKDELRDRKLPFKCTLKATKDKGSGWRYFKRGKLVW